MSPRYRLSVSEPTTAARNAPVRSCPSIAMLTTPTRSDMIPPIAPRARGTARTTALPRMNAKGREFPAANHASSATTASNPKIRVSHNGVTRLRCANTNETTAIATSVAPRTRPTMFDATRKSGRWIRSSCLDHWNATMSVLPTTPNATRTNTANAAIRYGVFLETDTSTCENNPGVTTVLISHHLSWSVCATSPRSPWSFVAGAIGILLEQGAVPR
ncbi:unannotated protein [freshwater metagenome]|uniref:Unannotated protein n=1 Tax=freshwater metagenome TaxID=449393 RepID=A0A6J6FEY1_9ZZZZ